MKLLLVWLINAACLLGTAYVVPGVSLGGFGTALVAALVLGLVNALIRPILGLLSLPITVLTLGLFSLVLNALMFGLAAWLVGNFSVSGFWPALFGALIYSVLSGVVNALLLSKDD